MSQRGSGLRVLLSGGGTGGHIYPAVAVADALRALEPDVELLFVGALGKMEMDRVPKAGYRIEGVPVSGFHRGFDRRNLSFPLRLASGLAAARRVVRQFAPSAAFGSGGFASGPALAAARLRGLPIFVQEQNAFPGVTNRLLGRVAQRVFTAYEEAARYFPEGRTLLTGNPLRGSLVGRSAPARAAAVVHFGLDPVRPVLLSFGGSLGAQRMNEAHAANQAYWRTRPDQQLIWQTGERYFERYSASDTAQLPNVVCLPYLERMDLAYAAADLVSCRAGALSVSELQLLGKPALLIPSPNVAGDHQRANARAVAALGGAEVLEDDEQTSKLAAALDGLLSNPEKLAAMAKAMRALARPDAAEQIARHILQHVAH